MARKPTDADLSASPAGPAGSTGFANAEAPGGSAQLLDELDALRRALAEEAARNASHAPDMPDDKPADGPLLAVARLFPGMTRQRWLALAEEHGLRQWFAIDLDKSTNFNLRELQKAVEDLAHQRDHDPLTGLMNRRAFLRQVELELQRVHRGGAELCLAMLDLDDFKRVNDTWGHACGDVVLRRMADLLRDATRAYDVAARIGGEEFVLLLPGASPMRAQALLERLLQDLRDEAFECRDETFRVSFSAGIAGCKGATVCRAEELLDRADKALYEAKASGKARVRVHRLPGVPDYDRSTMVQSDEKQFLFSGNDD
ncbi:GGDEF domain-containing protein [Nitratidesulfovibrio liaohensis]|uniref:GGDEF domain-containing protein n=1 Tax=Nitratidesulfovibrio liaohensis TaxID=2604158 RepID=UPI0014220636|nr:GGDEF domain-containing protein [Nitratidesulfovibrio liaohensis]NHZ46669.1 GGDEF domain-containing protein [Nitratidesulfovibrio liaohensis]